MPPVADVNASADVDACPLAQGNFRVDDPQQLRSCLGNCLLLPDWRYYLDGVVGDAGLRICDQLLQGAVPIYCCPGLIYFCLFLGSICLGPIYFCQGQIYFCLCLGSICPGPIYFCPGLVYFCLCLGSICPGPT